MKLKQFIEQMEISVQEGADHVGVTRQAFNRYLNGKRIPEAPVMKKIKTWTNGEVTADDFF